MCVGAKQIIGWTEGMLQDGDKPGPNNKFMSAVMTKGGAEGWVQVELDVKYKTLPNVTNVLREQHIYTNTSLAVDFQLDCKDGGYAFIEVKVESLFASSGQGHVTIPHDGWKGIRDDYEKLRDNRSATYAGSPAFCVALVWSEEATDGVIGWLTQNKIKYEYDSYGAMWENDMYAVRVIVIPVP